MYDLPVATATAVLLDFLGVCVDVAALCKEAGKIFLRSGSAFGDALVVTVVGLVGASHYTISVSGTVDGSVASLVAAIQCGNITVD